MSQKPHKPAQQVTPLPLLYAEQTQPELASATLTPLPLTPSTVSIGSFDVYRDQWLESVRADNPSTLELGGRFSAKLFTQWLDIEAASDDLIYCDGTGDGGIDIAYRSLGSYQESDEDQSIGGDTWYLVQSKYGSAFRGSNTLLTEGRKVIDTLEGQQKRLSSLAEDLQGQLQKFREKASGLDRIVLVFATEEPLSIKEQRAFQDVRTLGRERLGPLFDVDAISIHTIYQRVFDRPNTSSNGIKVHLKATLTPSGEDLYVGTVALLDLYQFLKSYQESTNDLDLLYEKNVRRSLGKKTGVNKKILETLDKAPERFGLYNNGITIVVTNLQKLSDGTIELTCPSIVNGCQTTQMIWTACNKWLKSGGTGKSHKFDEWEQKASKGVVITKIVEVGNTDLDLLRAIARCTNSQNAIRDQDFLALESDFNRWAEQMRTQYGIFMETQRGEWESQQMYQKQHPQKPSYKEQANAFDLIKVYGAGWLGVPGLAFADNAPFIPSDGTVYKKIIRDNKDSGGAFGSDDLYAAYCLKKAADNYGFGKKAGTKPSRGQTRYMFYMVVVELLCDILTWSSRSSSRPSLKDLTRALLRLFEPEQKIVVTSLLDAGVQLIDEYLSEANSDAVFKEPAYQSQFHNDLGSYLKWNALGKHDMAKNSPNLHRMLTDYKRMLGRPLGSPTSPRDLVLQVVTLDNTTQNA